MAKVHFQILSFIAVILALAAADPPSLTASDVTKQPSNMDSNISIVITSIESTTNLSNQLEEQRSDEASQSLVFWVFVSTSILMSLLLVLVRGYTIWFNDTKPDLSNPSPLPTQEDTTNGDHKVYGDMEAPTIDKSLEIVHDVNQIMKVSSPKSITDDIEEYVLRELSEIDASYPGFNRPPRRTSSVGYIEAIYARYSGGTEEEMRNEPTTPNLRIQINGQDVTCTKYGVELTPWSPTPTSREDIAPDEFVVTDEEDECEEEGIEIEEMELQSFKD